MPISLNITQPTGVIATYHIVFGGNYKLIQGALLSADVSSYLSQAAFSSGDQPLINQRIDVSFVLPTNAPTPPSGATIEQVVQSIIENALIVQMVPDPNSTSENPLPNIGGVFYGGTITT